MKKLRVVLAASVLLIGYGAIQVVQRPADAAETRTEVREVFAPDGSIDSVRVKVPVGLKGTARIAAAVPADTKVYRLQHSGPASKRFDLVFVAEGYTADQQNLFHLQAKAHWEHLTSFEPFATLKDDFNVWVVDAISQESGSDNDPTRGIRRNTALNSGYYCSDMERLICVDTGVTKQYAALAPGADQAIALVNSDTYGGSGGTVAVAAGGNVQSGNIIVHELGHSIGGLTDEYGGEGEANSANEPKYPNATKMTEEEMRRTGAKWAALLGQPTPDGGVIGLFEGADYYDKGVFRPSDNSMMRTLGKEFNLVGIDAITSAVKAKTIK